MNALKTFLRYEPVLLAWALNGGLAAFLAYATGLTSTQMAAVTTITTALVGIYTAYRTRPIAVSVITGALATIAVAIGAFGFNLSANEIGGATTIIGGVLMLLLRANVAPFVKPVPIAPTPEPVDPPAPAPVS